MKRGDVVAEERQVIPAAPYVRTGVDWELDEEEIKSIYEAGSITYEQRETLLFAWRVREALAWEPGFAQSL